MARSGLGVLALALTMINANCDEALAAGDAGAEADAGARAGDGGVLERDAGALELDASQGDDSGVGPECDCYRVGQCCDGYSAIAEGESCDDPFRGTSGPATCQAGRCIGEVACECESGPCCDGCLFRPTTHACGEVVSRSYCADDGVGACPGYSHRIWQEFSEVFCAGDSAECNGAAIHSRTVSVECDPGTFCEGNDGNASCTYVCEMD